MAAAAHCRVVRVCSSAIASRKAIATQKSATTTIFPTARAWIWSARIAGDARARSGPNYSHPPGALRYSPWTSMTHRLDSLALLLLLPLRGE